MAAKKKKSLTADALKKRVISNIKEQSRIRIEVDKLLHALKAEHAQMALLADLIKESGGMTLDELVKGPWAEDLKE